MTAFLGVILLRILSAMFGSMGIFALYHSRDNHGAAVYAVVALTVAIIMVATIPDTSRPRRVRRRRPLPKLNPNRPRLTWANLNWHAALFWLGYPAVVVVVVVLFAGHAFGQEPQQPMRLGPCDRELTAYCGHVVQGGGRQLNCLRHAAEARKPIGGTCRAMMVNHGLLDP